MRFVSDRQRRAVFASMFSAKRLYHGTSGLWGAAVEREGLRPVSQHKKGEGGHLSDPDYVYLTDDEELARMFAERQAEAFGGEPRVFEAELEEEGLEVDELFPRSFKYRGAVPRKKLKRVFSGEPPKVESDVFKYLLYRGFEDYGINPETVPKDVMDNMVRFMEFNYEAKNSDDYEMDAKLAVREYLKSARERKEDDVFGALLEDDMRPSDDLDVSVNDAVKVLNAQEEFKGEKEALATEVKELYGGKPGMPPEFKGEFIKKKGGKKDNEFSDGSAKEKVMKFVEKKVKTIKKIPGAVKKKIKFSMSDEAANKYAEFMRYAYQEKRKGRSVEELREEFKGEMGPYTIVKKRGESHEDYFDRARKEDKMVEEEVEYLSRLGALKR
jgi:hypothetical protein